MMSPHFDSVRMPSKAPAIIWVQNASPIFAVAWKKSRKPTFLSTGHVYLDKIETELQSAVAALKANVTQYTGPAEAIAQSR